jgi:hypothetical protein
VDDVELAGPLEDVRDVQALAHLRIGIRVLGVPARNDRCESAGRLRIGGCEECHVEAAHHEPFGQK